MNEKKPSEKKAFCSFYFIHIAMLTSLVVLWETGEGDGSLSPEFAL